MSQHVLIDNNTEPRELYSRGSYYIHNIETTNTWIEIDYTQLKANAMRIKTIIGNSIIMAVVKGNAYGHGLTLIGSMCDTIPEISWLCTALLSEALTLRKMGIVKPILVMGFIDNSLEQAIINDIDITIWSTKQAQEINNIAKKLNKKAYVHIKIDTGLGRLGIMPQKIKSLLAVIKKLSWIIVHGIFTHFSESNAHESSYTEKQIALFNQVLTTTIDSGFFIPLIHAANSAGYMNFPHARYTAIRTAASLFGLAETQSLGMKPIMQWKTRIAALKNIPTGQYIGYARTYITQKKTRIAVLPVGYADGYDRKLSNKGVVYIHNSPCNVIGRVCMNAVIVDVTHLNNKITVGDEVILLGNQPGCTADDIAANIGSFNREIVTRINPLIKRITI
jgi:alanine racemase